MKILKEVKYSRKSLEDETLYYLNQVDFNNEGSFNIDNLMYWTFLEDPNGETALKAKKIFQRYYLKNGINNIKVDVINNPKTNKKCLFFKFNKEEEV